MSEEELVGIARGQQVLQRGSKYPYLKLGPGDRARFHFLTSGGDHHFAAGTFHKFGQGRETRTLICTASLSEANARECKFCERGHVDTQLRFGCWIYLHQVLRVGDNPDSEGEPWKQAKVPEANRTMFVEDIKKAVTLNLAAGRGQGWFKQFSGFWMTRESNLQLDLYELVRTGVDLETEYTLNIIKEMAIKPGIAKLQADLPGTEELLVEEMKRSPHTAQAGGNMGQDALEGGGVDPAAEGDAEPALPTVEQVTQPAADEPQPEEDGLI
jgi:hypothetical protein